MVYYKKRFEKGGVEMLRILHAADLHLDSPFASLPPELAAQRHREQQWILQYAMILCNNVDLVLLAGDVFDDRQARPETVVALLTTFERTKAHIFIAPGNHDPYTEESVWARTNWPENVHIFTGAMEAVELPHLRCRVWGAAFREREAGDLLRPIPKSNDGFLEIGVFHGDPVYDSPYHPISAQTIRDCGLDYLALGHIHKAQMPQQLGRTFYGWPGVTMGRGFDETGEKGVFLLSLDRGMCGSKFVPLPKPRYELWKTDVDHLEIPPQYVQTICRLVLTGEANPMDTMGLYDRLSEQFLHLEIRDETIPTRDIWDGCGDSTLRGLTLTSLKTRFDAAETPEQRQLLTLAARYALAALEGREMP